MNYALIEPLLDCIAREVGKKSVHPSVLLALVSTCKTLLMIHRRKMIAVRKYYDDGSVCRVYDGKIIHGFHRQYRPNMFDLKMLTVREYKLGIHNGNVVKRSDSDKHVYIDIRTKKHHMCASYDLDDFMKTSNLRNYTNIAVYTIRDPGKLCERKTTLYRYEYGVNEQYDITRTEADDAIEGLFELYERSTQ